MLEELKALGESDEDEEGEKQSGEEEEEDSDGWQSEDDPDKLWCICRQPHNNRWALTGPPAGVNRLMAQRTAFIRQ